MSETENKNRFKIERISFRKKIERQKRENGRRRERLFVFEKNIFRKRYTFGIHFLNENPFDGNPVSKKVRAKRLGVQETGYMI